MGDIVGGITDAVGLTDNAGEKRAAEAAAANSAAASAMSKEQIELAKEQLEFQKDQYQDWKDVYGDIQENLGAYYKDLTPDKLVTLGLENQQREFQQVEQSIKRNLAQRGIADSGVETEAMKDLSFQNATARARIRTNADQAVVDEQLKFLGIGLNQGTQLLGVVGNAAANVTNAFTSGINSQTNLANSYLNQSTSLGVQGMSNIGKIASSISYTPG